MAWDEPMLSGYQHTVLNCEKGVPLSSWGSLTGKGVKELIDKIKPDAVLLVGLNYRYDLVAYIEARRRGIPVWLRCETQDYATHRSGVKSIVRSMIYRVAYTALSSSTINISVADPASPTVDAGEDVSLTLPENSLTLEPSVSSDVPVEYSWTQVEGPNTAPMSDPTAQSISVSDLIEGTYIFELTVTNENGLSTSDRISVTVVAGSTAAVSQSGIPRFFSPNDDGTGDYWEWSDVEPFENSLLSVYNRSGQKIYETLSYNNTWDGKMDGQPLQAGDYYYIIQMADATDIKGAVRIIR